MPGWWNGRHEGLKILWLYGCAGSSPASGTLIEGKTPYNQKIVRGFLILTETLLKLFIFPLIFPPKYLLFHSNVFFF